MRLTKWAQGRVTIARKPVSPPRLTHQIMKRRHCIKHLLLSACLLLVPLAGARDALEASPYGLILDDLLQTIYATSIPCGDEATGYAYICFLSKAVGVEHLRDRISGLVAEYEAAGFAMGEWESANGVWATALDFGNEKFGALEIYLAEVPGNNVKGLARLTSSR